jgi:hypothetical protein
MTTQTRYNFEVYPPSPIEIDEPVPSDMMLGLEEVCEGVFCSPSSPEPWMTSGLFVNIEDFWLSVDPPRYRDLVRTDNRWRQYLSTGTAAFRCIYQELMAQDRPNVSDRWARLMLYPGFMYQPNPELERRILVAHSAARRILELSESKGSYVPGIGPARRRVIRRALLDWDERIDFGADDGFGIADIDIDEVEA